MSSTIFYRFRSQKSQSRVLFDGTGLTVFELKKDIVDNNKLAPATDFDLRVYNADTHDEYDDDNAVVPRLLLVVVRRLPVAKNSKWLAARYVTGKPRVVNRGHKQATTVGAGLAATTAVANAATSGDTSNMTEEQRLANMFAAQSDVWKATQDDMLTQQAVYRPAQGGATNPEDMPPPGYMCYRCGEKNHWIKNCPKNDDPNWTGKTIKRTTGIPSSYLRTVSKPAEDGANGGMDDNNYMLTEDGRYVVAVPDSKQWERYQQKVSKETKVQYENVPEELKDPVSGDLFTNPVSTPCCHKVYSLKSIEDALLELDFVCPACGTADIYLDQLAEATEVKEKADAWVASQRKRGGDGAGGDAKRPQGFPMGAAFPFR